MLTLLREKWLARLPLLVRGVLLVVVITSFFVRGLGVFVFSGRAEGGCFGL